MAEAVELAVLIKKKEQQFAYLQKVYDAARNISTEKNADTVEKSMAALEHLFKDFIQVIERVNVLQVTIKSSSSISFSDMETAMDMYGFIKSQYLNLEKQRQAENATLPIPQASMETQPTQPGNTIKLQPLELPSFSGNIGEWPMFYQIFKVNIHDRAELSKAHKLQYLLSKLSGRAVSICAGIPPSADNYDVIWDRLVEKYEDSRNLATYYLDVIFNYKPMQKEGSQPLGLFVDKVGSTIAALKALNLDNLSEFILFYLAESKLDDSTKKLFEMSLKPREIPTIEQLLKFVQNQTKVLTRLQGHSSALKLDSGGPSGINNSSTYVKQYFKPKTSHSFLVNDNYNNCALCHGNHILPKCNHFLKLSPQDRYGVAKQNSLCVNCLAGVHKSNNCSANSCCNICNLNHHSLLHFPQGRGAAIRGKEFSATISKPTKNIGPQPVQPSDNNNSAVAGSSNDPKSDRVLNLVASKNIEKNFGSETTTVLLSTVKVLVFDNYGKAHELRFLLDSGSMCNLITDSVCKMLNLKPKTSNTVLSGIGSNSSPVQGQVVFKIRSIHDDRVNYSVQALVIEHLVDKMPVAPIDCKNLDYLEKIDLADNEFMKPGKIAGILGAPIYSYIINGKIVVGEKNQPVAMSTKFGYIMMGNACVSEVFENKNKEFCMFQKTELDQNLERFWQLDQVGECSFSKLTVAEQDCEQQFVDHVTRDLTGRYIVSLPFSGEISKLGDSFNSAQKRFFKTEKKLEFQSDPEASKGYKKSMQDLIDRGHMVESADQSDRSGYFIPHHMIVKPESTSSKLRIVFDAGAKTSTGISLNDILHTGAKLYSDLLGILLKFRLFPVALNGDITKMFLQILVNKSDCKFQKLLWRFDPSQPLTIYEMIVVIFGMRSSPFLAQRTVKQLIVDEGSNFPGAVGIEEYLYMDDCVASFPTESEAKLFYQDVVNLFKSGGFTFTKWISNSSDVMSVIPESDQLTKLVSFDHENDNIKILGMSWDANQDYLHFKIRDLNNKPCTKRGILSAVLTVYDPMGFLAPIVLWVKLLIREICTLKLDWDEIPPVHIVNTWSIFKAQLPELARLQFPRHIGVAVGCKFELIGFCDASMKGYGAIIYSRVLLENGNTVVNLICAKSKVAPLKVESIPRLELCSLLLLAKLMKIVLENYSDKFHVEKYYCFTDSTVSLCWTHGSPHQWNTFVANRVSKIQQILEVGNICHVKGTDNPADGISRGQLPSDFLENKLYFSGPSWLMQDEQHWPVKHYHEFTNIEAPEKKVTVNLVDVRSNKEDNIFLNMFVRISSWLKLLRVMFYILRFVKRLPMSMIASPAGLDLAERYVIKIIQNKYFSLDIDKINKGEPSSNSLRNLSPFLDENNILRVGGRLSNAQLTQDQQHPILLPKCHVTNIIIDYVHIKNLHAGPHLALSLLRQKFWILGGRNLVRQRFHSCNSCFKVSPKFVQPKMGDLPVNRVLESKPFFHTACDYLGPLNVLMQRKRGSRPVKVYICLFICLAVKALHFEVVSSLTTEAFLNAFKRFLARRGPVKSMLSDNGTNFVGAKNKLNEIYALLDSQDYKDSFSRELLENRIEWKFNPPGSPHFGGIFESNVKSFKTHFFRVVGNQLLTLEELLTLTVQIESILNSRPLCTLSPDPSEVPLTPNHFLNMTGLRHIPAECVEMDNSNRLTRFQLLDQMVQSFWRKWSLEYLHELQVRAKWTSSCGSIKPGLVVLLRQANTAPLCWPMGVVTQVFPGKDGIVRVALVRTPGGEFRRAVTNLCPLPVQ